MKNRRGRGRARAAGTTSAGTSSRAATATAEGSAPGHVPPVIAHPGRRLLLDHRRLRHPRPRARSRPLRQVRVRRPLQAQPSAGHAPPAGHAVAPARTPRSRAWSRSARTGAGACTPSRWTGRSTGSRARERSRPRLRGELRLPGAACGRQGARRLRALVRGGAARLGRPAPTYNTAELLCGAGSASVLGQSLRAARGDRGRATPAPTTPSSACDALGRSARAAS